MKSIGYKALDRAELQAWMCRQGEGGDVRRARLLKNLPRAIAAELTPRQQEILDMYLCQDMNTVEIARELEINKSTVSRSLQRSFQRLKRCLQYSL